MSDTLKAGVCGGLAALVLFVDAAAAGFFSSPDPNWSEAEYAFPAPPDEGSLQQFPVSAASRNQFMLDLSSLSVGSDGVVRYVLVVRTPGGAVSITFEGIRCATGQQRIYATGRAGGAWAAARRSEWERIPDAAYNQPRAVLAGTYFCDGAAPLRTREEVVRRLSEEIRISP